MSPRQWMDHSSRKVIELEHQYLLKMQEQDIQSLSPRQRTQMTTYTSHLKNRNPTIGMAPQVFFTRMCDRTIVNPTESCKHNVTGLSAHKLVWRIHGSTSCQDQYHTKLTAKLCQYVTNANMHPSGQKGHRYGYLKISTKKEGRKILS